MYLEELQQALVRAVPSQRWLCECKNANSKKTRRTLPLELLQPGMHFGGECATVVGLEAFFDVALVVAGQRRAFHTSRQVLKKLFKVGAVVFWKREAPLFDVLRPPLLEGR